MAIVYSVVSLKGGTGKTSLTKFLGITKAAEGKRVLLIDLCQNSDIATRFGYDRYQVKYDTYDWVAGIAPFEEVVYHDEETGVDFIPASAQVEKITEFAQKRRAINQEWILKEKLAEVKDRYDYIFFDNHPTETNRMMVFSLCASDIALVPTTMDISSVMASMRTIDLINDLRSQGVSIEFSVVPMAVDFTKGFKKELESIIERFKEQGVKNFTTPVRNSTVVTKSGLNNVILDTKNEYMKKVMEDYKQISAELDQLFVR